MDGFIPPRRFRLLYGRVPSRFSSTAAIAMTGFVLTFSNPTPGEGANPPARSGKDQSAGKVIGGWISCLHFGQARSPGISLVLIPPNKTGISIILCGLRLMVST